MRVIADPPIPEGAELPRTPQVLSGTAAGLSRVVLKTRRTRAVGESFIVNLSPKRRHVTETIMYRLLPIIFLGMTATAASASDCAELDLTSEGLTQYFCDALKDIGDAPERTRSAGSGGQSEADPLPDWAEVEIIKEAYRADPRKTLDLIKRIKNAGGLGDN